MTVSQYPLFLWINLTPNAPVWLLELARLSSTLLPGGLLLCVLLGAVVGPRTWRRLALRMLFAMALAWLITRGLSGLFPSPRPFALGVGFQGLAHPATPSFPSSHASVACAFAASAWFTATSVWVRWLSLLLALLITWSRVALGLHFPVDALAGVLIGVASVALLRLQPLRTPRRAQGAVPEQPVQRRWGSMRSRVLSRTTWW